MTTLCDNILSTANQRVSFKTEDIHKDSLYGIDSASVGSSSSDESTDSEVDGFETSKSFRGFPAVSSYLPVISVENINNNMRCTSMINDKSSCSCRSCCDKRKDTQDSLHVQLDSLRKANLLRLTDRPYALRFTQYAKCNTEYANTQYMLSS